jgi:hypothetical protein
MACILPKYVVTKGDSFKVKQLYFWFWKRSTICSKATQLGGKVVNVWFSGYIYDADGIDAEN